MIGCHEENGLGKKSHQIHLYPPLFVIPNSNTSYELRRDKYTKDSGHEHSQFLNRWRENLWKRKQHRQIANDANDRYDARAFHSSREPGGMAKESRNNNLLLLVILYLLLRIPV